MRKLIILSAFLGLVMCKTNPDTNNVRKLKGKEKFCIHGLFKNADNKYLCFQEIRNNNFITLDSILIDEEGRFSYEHEAKFPSFYALKNESGDYVILIPEASETISITGDYTFGNYMIENSPHSEIVADLFTKTRNFISEVSEIAAINRDSIYSTQYHSIKINMALKYDSLFNDLKNYSLDLINNNIQSPAVILALLNQPGTGTYVFDPFDDLEIFSKVDSIMYYLYPDFLPVKSLHEKLKLVKAQLALKEQQQKDN